MLCWIAERNVQKEVGCFSHQEARLGGHCLSKKMASPLVARWRPKRRTTMPPCMPLLLLVARVPPQPLLAKWMAPLSPPQRLVLLV